MFSKIVNLFQPKEKPAVIVKNWRSGMWVTTDGRTGILAEVAPLSEVHFVDNNTGETVEIKQVSLDALQQAHYDEIPAIRRKISREQAKGLGYGT